MTTTKIASTGEPQGTEPNRSLLTVNHLACITHAEKFVHSQLKLKEAKQMLGSAHVHKF
jgi:hypothetical protein